MIEVLENNRWYDEILLSDTRPQSGMHKGYYDGIILR